jgi:hypothetical protein
MRGLIVAGIGRSMLGGCWERALGLIGIWGQVGVGRKHSMPCGQHDLPSAL